jgi:alcohol dehydrogenase class IV
MITDTLWEFWTAGKTKFGYGAAEETGCEAKNLGATKTLVTTDKGITKAGLVDKLKRSLNEPQTAHNMQSTKNHT